MAFVRSLFVAAVAAVLASCVPPYVPPATGADGRPIEAKVAVSYQHEEVRGLARDGDTLFASVFRYADGAIGTSAIVRIDGQKVTPIVSNLQAPSEVAVDSTWHSPGFVDTPRGASTRQE